MIFTLRKRVETDGVARNLAFGNDGRIWFDLPRYRDRSTHRVATMDPVSYQQKIQFEDHNRFVFFCNQTHGAIATEIGDVFRFSVRSPKLYRCRVTPDLEPIECIHVDSSGTITVSTMRRIYQFDANGKAAKEWETLVPPCAIHYVPSAHRIWLAGDGLQVINTQTDEVSVIEKDMNFPYANITSSATRSIACFGGDIDIFSFDGVPVRCIPGTFNRGVFASPDCLVACDVQKFSASRITFSTETYGDIEVIVLSSCDSVAFNDDGSTAVISNGGALSIFDVE